MSSRRRRVHHVITQWIWVITSPLLSQQTLRKRKRWRSQCDRGHVCVCVSPQVDEVDEFGGELSLLRAAELWRVTLHHLRQLIEHTVPLRVGEPSRGQFILKQQCNRNHFQYHTHKRSHDRSSSSPVWFPNSRRLSGHRNPVWKRWGLSSPAEGQTHRVNNEHTERLQT